jgi:hypothetical protein
MRDSVRAGLGSDRRVGLVDVVVDSRPTTSTPFAIDGSKE